MNNIEYESLCNRLEIINSDYEDMSKSDVIKDVSEWNKMVLEKNIGQKTHGQAGSFHKKWLMNLSILIMNRRTNMNLRTRYKKLKQYVELSSLHPTKIFFDMPNLEHFRSKANYLLPYERRNPDADELALRVAKDKLKDEFSKLIDEYIEVLPDGTVTLDIWLKPKNEIQKVRIINDKNNL